jgi:hypothetical protein
LLSKPNKIGQQEPTGKEKSKGCSKSTGCGCFSAIAIYVAICIAMGGLPPMPGPEMFKSEKSDGTVRWATQITCPHFSDALTPCAWQLAEEVYEKASSNQSASRAEVTVTLYVTNGVRDKYGNKLENPTRIGILAINNLNEVRKYKQAIFYSDDNETIVFYKSELESMRDLSLMKYPH